MERNRKNWISMQILQKKVKIQLNNPSLFSFFFRGATFVKSFDDFNIFERFRKLGELRIRMVNRLDFLYILRHKKWFLYSFIKKSDFFELCFSLKNIPSLKVLDLVYFNDKAVVELINFIIFWLKLKFFFFRTEDGITKLISFDLELYYF